MLSTCHKHAIFNAIRRRNFVFIAFDFLTTAMAQGSYERAVVEDRLCAISLMCQIISNVSTLRS